MVPTGHFAELDVIVPNRAIGRRCGRTATMQSAPPSGDREAVSIISQSGLDGKAFSAKTGSAPGVRSPANKASCGTESIPKESSRSGAISGARKSPAGSAGGTLFPDNGHTASSSLLHSARIVTTSFRASKKPTAIPARAGKLFLNRQCIPRFLYTIQARGYACTLGLSKWFVRQAHRPPTANERIGDSQWEQWTRR